MNIGLYAVLDTLAETLIGSPMTFKADAAAVRLFSDAMADTNSVIAKHPNDHVLLHLGDLDEQTGAIIVSDVSPRVVISGTQLIMTRQAANESL